MAKETFQASRYEKRAPRGGRYGPGGVVYGYACPFCGGYTPLMEEGDKADCVGCGVHVELWGNALEVTWREAGQ